MKADFTRDTFDPNKHFSRVLKQQGRVSLDADDNEQASILVHYLRTLTRDLTGPYGAPLEEGGFKLIFDNNGKLTITEGRYYVDGIMIGNEQDCLYIGQPDYPLPKTDKFGQELDKHSGEPFFLYLDVWERLVTSIEDDDIREKALGGPDTCARAKVVWQVKAWAESDIKKTLEGSKRIVLLNQDKAALANSASRAQLAIDAKPAASIAPAAPAASAAPAATAQPTATREPVQTAPAADNTDIDCQTALGLLNGISNALLAARIDPGRKIEDACIISPDAKYRGFENQLYRVEIHDGSNPGPATFKWSRDNGSVCTSWLGTSGNDLQVASSRGFEAGNWIELSDDTSDLNGLPGVLVKLTNVEPGKLSVDPNSFTQSGALDWSKAGAHPKVRRWDQVQTEKTTLTNGVIAVQEKSTVTWIDLEDGIQIQFGDAGQYRTGDYWLIPARVATGTIEWPATLDTATKKMVPNQELPDGIEHHYAPLGFVQWNSLGQFDIKSCRCEFVPYRACFDMGTVSQTGKLLTETDIDSDIKDPSKQKARVKRPRKQDSEG
ncbi:MAG TPA: DUF6519 domain-containing protein [Blastocatellia bacterium]|nr:DUF6519 domain-containing protein [Blastocatellia bacterium]